MSATLEFPSEHATVYHTAVGTPYLKQPGIVVLAQTATNLDGLRGFLEGYDGELGFSQYLEDNTANPLGCSETLVKFAGQLCYMSLGAERTKNTDAYRYFDNLRTAHHGSVLEHASLSFLLYGVDRSFTHELVRHRVGVAYSQVSQRYVDGKMLRFVERAEYQNDPVLHRLFEDWIDLSADQYELRVNRLAQLQLDGSQILSGEKKRDLRKKLNQAARACLPNEAEAPILMTANIRSLRHIVEMRASASADIQIRNVAVRMLTMAQQCSNLLNDHTVAELQDGTKAITTKTQKV